MLWLWFFSDVLTKTISFSMLCKKTNWWIRFSLTTNLMEHLYKHHIKLRQVNKKTILLLNKPFYKKNVSNEHTGQSPLRKTKQKHILNSNFEHLNKKKRPCLKFRTHKYFIVSTLRYTRRGSFTMSQLQPTTSKAEPTFLT